MSWSVMVSHGQRHCSWARTHDGDGDGDGGGGGDGDGDGDDDEDDGVAQQGGHTLNNRLTQTFSLGLPCTSLILARAIIRDGDRKRAPFLVLGLTP